jgi:pyruvate,water dikinase
MVSVQKWIDAEKRGPTIMSKQIIFWFEELGPEHNDVVGKKCANLGKLTTMGLAVPPGFALSIDMYLEFIKTTGVDEQLASHVTACGDLKGANISIYEELSATMRSTIENQEMPTNIKELISSYYAELCEKTGIEDLAVSVRSAGTQSRPGMFETYLNVSGIDDVLAKVRKVWASSYTPRAIAFRSNKGLPVIGDELGVAIPKMVKSRASGIAFTVNPVDGDASKILLEANWGLGEGVVSGAESVDGFVVNKDTLEIEERHVGNKTKYVIYTENGADWADMPEKLRNVSCLSDEEIIEVARVAKSTEASLNDPQDMEWAIDQDLDFPNSLFWLQTRKAKVAAKKAESTSAHIADLISKKLKGF